MVGAISVCLECDAVRRFGDNPPPLSQRLPPSLVKTSLQRLERIKALLKRAGLPTGSDLRRLRLAPKKPQLPVAGEPSDDWSRLQSQMVACFSDLSTQGRFDITRGESEFRVEAHVPLSDSAMAAAGRCLAFAETHLEDSSASAGRYSLEVQHPNGKSKFSVTLRRNTPSVEKSSTPKTVDR